MTLPHCHFPRGTSIPPVPQAPKPHPRKVSLKCQSDNGTPKPSHCSERPYTNLSRNTAPSPPVCSRMIWLLTSRDTSKAGETRIYIHVVTSSASPMEPRVLDSIMLTTLVFTGPAPSSRKPSLTTCMCSQRGLFSASAKEQPGCSWVK